MKKLLFLAILFCGTLQLKAQEFHVLGNISGFDEGTPVMLLTMSDNGFLPIDSIGMPANGIFQLKGQVDKTQKAVLFIGIMDTPNAAFNEFFVSPGKTTTVTGEHFAGRAWKIESDIPEQVELNRFSDAIRESMYELEKTIVELNPVQQAFRRGEVNNKERMDELQSRTKMLREDIDKITLKTIIANPNTDIAQEKLAHLSMGIKFEPHLADMRQDIAQAYQMLSPGRQASPMGKEIYTALYGQVAENGKPMPDLALTTPEGNLKKLSDYSGKYILLDFWASWCGVCISSFPEVKELADKYKEQLVVIGINVDKEPEAWKSASEKHRITWTNLYAGDEHTIGVLYGIKGIPHLTLISPEGIVLENKISYSQGALEKRFLEYKNR